MSVATLTEAVARPPAGATTRVAAFDGMRGVACLLVVASHYFGHGYSFSRLVEGGGTVGVMMFFVLSGYLIGGILIDHHDSPSYFRTFYVRRAFRIFPIYYVVIGLSPLAMVVCTWTPQYFSIWSYLTYTVNFSMAFSGEYGNALMVPVWSLCIEEQFYLLFPLLLYALPRHWRLERVLLVLIVLAVVCRGVLAGAGANELYGKMLLPTRMDALALGVLAAHVRRTPALRHWLSQDNSIRIKLFTIVGLLISPALSAVENFTGMPVWDGLGFLALGVSFTGLILLIADGAPEAKRLRLPLLCFFGTISYCLYLIHLPILCVLQALILGGIPPNFTLEPASLDQTAVTALAFAVSVGIAFLSWILFEGPLVRYAHRWRYEQTRTSAFAAEPAPELHS